MNNTRPSYSVIKFCLFLRVGWDWVYLVRRPLIGLLYQPRVIENDNCGVVGGLRISRGNRSTRKNPAPVPFCPPQIPHDRTWDWTRAAAVGSRQLTAWAMARPIFLFCKSQRSTIVTDFCLIRKIPASTSQWATTVYLGVLSNSAFIVILTLLQSELLTASLNEHRKSKKSKSIDFSTQVYILYHEDRMQTKYKPMVWRNLWRPKKNKKLHLKIWRLHNG
jgi:hypothetical protein